MDRPLGAGPPAWPPAVPPGAPPAGALGPAPGGYRPPALKMQQPAHQTGLSPSLLSVRRVHDVRQALPSRSLLLTRWRCCAALCPARPAGARCAGQKARRGATIFRCDRTRAQLLCVAVPAHCVRVPRAGVGAYLHEFEEPTAAPAPVPATPKETKVRLCVCWPTRASSTDRPCVQQEQKALRCQAAVREKGAALLERTLASCVLHLGHARARCADRVALPCARREPCQ